MLRYHYPGNTHKGTSVDVARIAFFLSEYSRCRVRPEDIEILAGPDDSGKLRVGWRFDHFAQHFVLTADGQVHALDLKRTAWPTISRPD